MRLPLRLTGYRAITKGMPPKGGCPAFDPWKGIRMERIKHYCLECGEDTLWRRVVLTVERRGVRVPVFIRKHGKTSTVYRAVTCTNRRAIEAGIVVTCGVEIPFAEFIKSIQDEYSKKGDVAHKKRVEARSAAIQSGESVLKKKAFQTYQAYFYPDGHKLCWPEEVMEKGASVKCDSFSEAVELCKAFVGDHSCKLLLHKYGSEFPYEVNRA